MFPNLLAKLYSISVPLLLAVGLVLRDLPRKVAYALFTEINLERLS